MRQDIQKSAIIEEESLEIYPVEPEIVHKNTLEDEIEVSKHLDTLGVNDYASNTMAFGKRGLRLFELASPPQIDGNLALGTHFYLQRHIFMIFTDVILALLLGNSLWILQSTALSINVSILSFLGVFCPIYFSIIKCFWHIDASYGHDNILYYVINGIRLVLFYGLCYTGPSVYNSNAGNLFAFSVFLAALRFMILVFKCLIGLKLKKFKSSGLTLNLIVEGIPAILYLSIIVVQSKLAYKLNLIYIIWAIGIIADFLSFIVSDGLSVWCRTSVEPEDLNAIISKKSYTEQLNSDTYDRMKILTLAIFGWGGSQLFPSRKGVGMPDLFVSFDYSVVDFLVGMMGILIIYFLMRSYVASITNIYFKAENASKRVNIFIALQKLLHAFIHALLFMLLNLLNQCIADIWDHLNRFPGSGYYFDFAQVTGYQFSLWRSLPYPTEDMFTNFLRTWVAKQTTNSTPPPGIYSLPSNMTGTSLLNFSVTDPGIIFCSTLGIFNILLLFMHWTSQMIESLQNSKNDANDCKASICNIIITFNSFKKLANAVIFLCLAGIDVKYLNILWKMVIITAATFIQVILDDSQRILSYGRSFP